MQEPAPRSVGDVILLSQTEVGEVREEIEESGGSSSMRNKHNPIAAISAVACAEQVPGLIGTLFAAAEQEHQRAAGRWHSEWLSPVVSLTASATAWVRESLEHLVVNPARMAENLDRSGIATDDRDRYLAAAAAICRSSAGSPTAAVRRSRGCGVMTSAVPVNFVESGRPDGPLVVLAHPIGTSLAIWEPQLPALEERFRVVRYDARGHGSSPVPAGAYSMADLGADLVALIERLGGGPASIVGQSLGGMTALWMAENAPELVDRIVCCCITARTASPDAWRDRAARVRRSGTESIHDLVLQRWGYADRRPDLATWILAQLDATPDEGYAGACEAIAELDLEPRLGSIHAPVLVVAGEDDPAAPPAAAEQIAAAIPGGRAVTVPNSAHLLNREQPDVLTALLLEHLGAASAAGARIES